MIVDREKSDVEMKHVDDERCIWYDTYLYLPTI